MALTVALGTVGAIGTGVYMTQRDADEAAQEAALEAEADEVEEELPEWEDPEPVPAAAAPEPVTPPTPPVVDTVLPADEDLTEVPAPYSEGAWMNS
ncbi:MAG: hypothetical protein AAF721_16425 [Myxococcota bacterium]